MSKLTLILLCAFVFMLPFEAMLWFNAEDIPSVSKFIGVALVGSALVAFLAGHPLRMPNLAVLLRILIVVLCAISYAWSVNQDETISYLKRLAQLLIFFLLIWEFAVSYDDQLWVFRSLLAGMIVPAFMALRAFQSASRVEIESGERFTGGGQDLNYLAYMLCVAVLISVYMARNQRPLDRALRWGYWGLAAWCVLQTMLTGSRGGLLSLLITSVFVALLSGMKVGKALARKIMRIAIRLVLILAVGWFLGRTFVPQELFNRFTLGGAGGTSIEDDPRVRIWNRGMEGFWKHPIMGVGCAGFYTVAADEKGVARAPHSTFISVLVELGVVGLALYLLFLALLFRAAWRLPHRERLFWLGVLSISVLNCITCGSQGDKFTWFLYAMVVVQEAALGPLNKRRARPALCAASRRRLSDRFIPACEGPDD